MQVTLRRNTNGGVDITPVAGKFAGIPVATAEHVYVRSQDRGVYGEPVRLRAVYGLVIHDDAVHSDGRTLRALSLLGPKL